MPASGSQCGHASSDAAGNLVVKAFQCTEHCRSDHPRFTATQEDSLHNSVAEESLCTGRNPITCKDTGNHCPL